ncbi:MAG: phosphodiester glycosidase family protein [Pseudomonadota bacterium]
MRTCAAIWIAISLAGPSFAGECEDISFEGASYTICKADPATETIRVHLNSADGTLLGSFGNLEAELGETPLWAMNAGMYHDDRRPVGLYIENGAEIAPIVTREGPGNFGLLPNGVLCLSAGSARVYEARQFADERPDCAYATQSGPMLVIEGTLHPRFLEDSDSLFRRNGVGVTQGGMLIAAISNERVNFHSFARLFRDILKTPNALFLDGNISRLHAPNLGRQDVGFPMGPILSVTATGG